MAKKQIGGSFAPPLSDELLDRYQSISTSADGPIKDALTTLLACCRKWLELPESVGGGNAHPSGRGFIVELDHTIKDELWNFIPWPHEINAIESVLETCQAEAAAINVARRAAWAKSVTDHYVTERLGGYALIGRVRVARQFLDQLAHTNDTAVADALRLAVDLMFPDNSLEQAKQKIAACQDEINAALRPDGSPPVPRPPIEDTRLRDAGFHLLWHVKELNLDREPITTDKLA